MIDSEVLVDPGIMSLEDIKEVYPCLDVQEQGSLMERNRNGDPEAAEILVYSNLNGAIGEVRKCLATLSTERRSNIDDFHKDDDSFEWGREIALKALWKIAEEKHEPNGSSFLTYAQPWIRIFLENYLQQHLFSKNIAHQAEETRQSVAVACDVSHSSQNHTGPESEIDLSMFSDALEKIKEDPKYKVRVLIKHIIQGLGTDIPEGFEVWPKQKRFVSEFKSFFSDSEHTSGFVKYPPGLGKTVLMSLLIRAINCLPEKKRVLVLASRKGINQQNINTISNWQEEGVIVKNIRDINTTEEADVVVALYDVSSESKGDITNLDLGVFDMVLLDECHRSFGNKFNAFIQPAFEQSLVIGFSATPYVGNTRNKSGIKTAFDYFDGEIDHITLKEGCEDSDLAPIRAHRIEITSEDFSSVNNEKDLSKVLDTAARTSLVKQLLQNVIPKGEPVLVFCDSVEHSKDVTKQLLELGIRAAHVDGTMKDSSIEKIREGFYNGDIDVVTNVNLLTEGYDNERIQHVIMLTGKYSVWEYEQCIGRGTRKDKKNPDKVLHVWDIVGKHAGHCTIHGLARFYGDINTEFQNGALLFAPQKNKAEDRSKGSGKIIESLASLSMDPVYLRMGRIETIEEVGEETTMNLETYYDDTDIVLHDLQAFADAMGKDIDQLNFARETLMTTVETKRGLVSFKSWVRRYKDITRSNSYIDALKKLGETVAIVFDLKPRNVSTKVELSNYYKDFILIKDDLERFAEAAGVHPSELTCKKRHADIRVETWFGEVSLLTWVKRFAEIEMENDIYSNALIELQERVGYPSKKKKVLRGSIEVKDSLYFNRPKNIEQDLNVFSLSIGVTIESLRAESSKNEKVKVGCGIGTLNEWLKAAGEQLGIKTKGEVLKELKRRIGVMHYKCEAKDALLFDGKMQSVFLMYFESERQVKNDLQAFADSIQSSIGLLTTNQGRARKVVAKTGMGEVTLCQWGQAYALKKGISFAEAITELKQRIGVYVINAREVSEGYYDDINQIKSDLESFAASAGTTVSALSLSKNWKADTGQGNIALRVWLKRYVAFHPELNFPSALERLKNMSRKPVGTSVTDDVRISFPENYCTEENLERDLTFVSLLFQCEISDLSFEQVKNTDLKTSFGVYRNIGELVEEFRRMNRWSPSMSCEKVFEYMKSRVV